MKILARSGGFSLCGGMSVGVGGISAPTKPMTASSSVEWEGRSSSKICGVYMEDDY